MIAVEDLMGKFRVKGHNQDQEKSPYKGILDLKLDAKHQIIAHWLIGKDQHQWGTGFYRNQILVINFEYGELREFKGVVVYKCLTEDILEGFWAEQAADPQFQGSENAFRITQDLLN